MSFGLRRLNCVVRVKLLLLYIFMTQIVEYLSNTI